jgi:hypothetical protein
MHSNKDKAVSAGIKAAPRPANIPLSFSQERLWFIDRFEGTIPYHVPAVLRLKGNLNKEALVFALQQVVDRHEILRTVFKEKDGQAFQLVTPKDNWKLRVVNGSNYKNSLPDLQQLAMNLTRSLLIFRRIPCYVLSWYRLEIKRTYWC